jgi:hypothetical protein
MAHTLILHVVARHEYLLAETVPGESGPGESRGAAQDAAASWHDTATGLIDALTGLFTAPVTSDSDAPSSPRKAVTP